MAHEGEGHLSVISEGQGDAATVARCLVLSCDWRTEQAQQDWAVAAAQQHWMDTREQH